MAVRKLNPQEIQWLLDDTLHSFQIDQTLAKFGPEWTRSMYVQFLKENPDVKALVDQAELDACPLLENDFLNIHKNKAITSHQIAAQLSANIKTVLAARKPEKYGNKIDITVTPVSIRAAMEKADERLVQLMRDVTPAVIAVAIQKEEK